MSLNNKVHRLLPVFLSVKRQSCVVIGGGKVALRKTKDLIEAGGRITVIAEKPLQEIVQLHEKEAVTLIKRRYKSDDIEGAFLVFAATDDFSLNSVISDEAKKNGILVNVVDCPELCSFYTGAVVKRGPLQIAVSTGGNCPAIAAELRRELEELYAEDYGDFIRSAGEWRKHILSLDSISDETKQKSLRWLAKKETYTLYSDSGKESVWEELKKIIYSS